jgi:hypothetical protein
MESKSVFINAQHVPNQPWRGKVDESRRVARKHVKLSYVKKLPEDKRIYSAENQAVKNG